MKRSIIVVLLCVILGTFASAQSSRTVGVILLNDTATYGDAAYLLLAARGLIDDEVGLAGAAGLLEFNGYGTPGRLWLDPITLGEYAVLLRRVLGLPGGFMSALTDAPRYAVRDLRHYRIIQGRAYPNMTISGERMVRILGRALAWQDGTL